MSDSLGDRIKDYESCYDFRIIRRLPIIIRVDGKSFSRLTRKINKPFDAKFASLMANTMLYCATEMQGCLIAYQQSDEITFVLQNNQSIESEPWFDNRIQKMASVSAALATLAFNRAQAEAKLDLVGDALFDARVFALPVNEVVNSLIWRQLDCIKNAISSAAMAELGKKFGRKSAMKILDGKNSSERKDMLFEHCQIDFDDNYPMWYKRGIVAAKVPTVIKAKEESIVRNKWAINTDLPEFLEDKDYLINILLNGSDVYRANKMP